MVSFIVTRQGEPLDIFFIYLFSFLCVCVCKNTSTKKTKLVGCSDWELEKSDNQNLPNWCIYLAVWKV